MERGVAESNEGRGWAEKFTLLDMEVSVVVLGFPAKDRATSLRSYAPTSTLAMRNMTMTCANVCEEKSAMRDAAC